MMPLAPAARHSRRSLVVSLVLCATCLGALTLLWRPLAQALLPWQAAALRTLPGPFELRSIGLRGQGADEALSAQLQLTAPLPRRDGKRVVFPHGAQLTVSTSAAKALLPLALLCVPLLLWPVADPREWALRGGFACVTGAALVALDLPLALLGEAWALLHDEVPSLRHGLSEALGRFFGSGGGMGLALGAALAIVAAARWLVDGWSD